LARMSVEKRIALGTSMIERWKEKGYQSDRKVRFVEDMLRRLDRGRSLSTKQRSWYDEVVLSDPPAPKNEEMVNRLLEDADLEGMEKVSSTIRDFAYKLSRGWALSEKQQSFLDKLIAQADSIRQNGRWVPTEHQKKQIEMGVAFCRRYTPYYLGGQPGTSKALHECKAWLAGDIDFLEEWSANRMMKVCKGDRLKLADAADRWVEGSLVSTKSGELGLVLSKPEVSQTGKPAIKLLINGFPKFVDVSDIKKDRRRKKIA